MKRMMSIAMVALGAMVAQAALVMDLSGNFNTGTARPTVVLPSVTTVDANTKFYNGLATPYVTNNTPVTGGAYTGPTLYASWRQSNVGGFTADPTRRIASTDYLENTAGASTVANAAGTFNFMYMVKKANFASGLSLSNNIGFDATSDFSLTATTWTANSKSLRAVVQNGTTWYISQTEDTSGSAGTKTLANAASMRWSVWDPTAQAAFSGDALDFTTTVAGSTFTDIQAVGVWGRFVETTTANANPSASITAIQIGAVAVPEPATVGMLGLGAVVTLLLRRMRR